VLTHHCLPFFLHRSSCISASYRAALYGSRARRISHTVLFTVASILPIVQRFSPARPTDQHSLPTTWHLPDCNVIPMRYSSPGLVSYIYIYIYIYYRHPHYQRGSSAVWQVGWGRQGKHVAPAGGRGRQDHTYQLIKSIDIRARLWYNGGAEKEKAQWTFRSL